MEVVPAVCFDVTGVGVNVWSTAIIAAFTVLLFVWQWRQFRLSRTVARANYRLSLYEKRLDVFYALKTYFDEHVFKSKVEMENARAMYRSTIAADYVFGEEVRQFIDQLYKIEVDLNYLDGKCGHINNKVELQVELTEEEAADRAQYVNENTALLTRRFKMGSEDQFYAVFEDYLNLPNEL
ncbi:hypothetical protein [Leisingera sp. ANG-M6]|uniref:hypothetical protein n=1 Tax=Leisingera sp. ANG-M6 TaxID=1577900 RepID=UPI001269E982|nr:hypothetical protein [Leisingera sp. ANG-M6]